MKLSQILSPERTRCDVESSSKKRALEDIAQLVADDVGGLDAGELFNQLLAREKLGSTGLGDGVAIPHCRAADCPRVVGALLKLDSPIDFEAVDDVPVDLLFALIVPEQAHDEHLKALAAIAELASRDDFRRQLRACRNDAELYQTVMETVEQV